MNKLTKYCAIMLTLAAAILAPQVMAQTVKVSAPSAVYEGTRFNVSFVVDDKVNGKDFTNPTFKGLSVIGGPSISSSSSYSFVNGKQSSSKTTTFTFMLQADNVGSFTIGPATCVVDGKKIASEPFTITVEKGNPQQQQQQQQQASNGWADPWGQPQPRQQQPANIDSKNLFARASINKSNLYQGEQAIITYKIYTQVPISQFQIDKLPGNRGFWAEDLSEGKQVKQYEETIDGQRYSVAEIRRGALFAQESGQLRIEPLNLDVLAIVQQQRRRTGTIWDIFDDPFFSQAQSVEKHLSSNAITVNVKPLPAAPEGFCGAVGNYKVSAAVDRQQAKANESITYRLTVSGSGNLMLIKAPDIQFSNAFEVYDPQVKDNLGRTDAGVSGSRTFEWLLIPRSQGEYEIPAYTFAYFDPQQGRYVSQAMPSIALHVDKGDANAMQNISSAKSDVKILHNDINYIKTGATRLRPAGEQESLLWFWATLLAIAIAAAATIAIGLRRQAAQKDVAGTKLRRATREARKRLKKAAAHLNDGNDNGFYEEIYKAIWGCLADKYNIPLASLSSDTVRDILTERHIAEQQKEHILKTLADVDFARFAPGDSASKKQQIYDEALAMIASL